MEAQHSMNSFLQLFVAGNQGAKLEARGAKVFGEAVCDVYEVRVDDR
jgi:hypothetical protein